jgi:hypothetical protein
LRATCCIGYPDVPQRHRNITRKGYGEIARQVKPLSGLAQKVAAAQKVGLHSF